jgi:inositol phosphorylceramide glucuronosyltransferase 1
VVYLDADTIVIHNMDEIFSCPGFCATLRHSERFNSGVMVITPSKALFTSIIESIATTQSYTGYDCLSQ